MAAGYTASCAPEVFDEDAFTHAARDFTARRHDTANRLNQATAAVAGELAQTRRRSP